MTQFIRFQKAGRDQDFTQLNVTAKNAVISATARIYVTEQMMEELHEQLETFLSEPDLEGYWENDVPAIGGPPCVTMKFLPQKHTDLLLVEIYLELNDGGSFMDHNCRFYVESDRDHLQAFSRQLPGFLTSESQTELTLNQ